MYKYKKQKQQSIIEEYKTLNENIFIFLGIHRLFFDQLLPFKSLNLLNIEN
jgi:hypothetical protein